MSNKCESEKFAPQHKSAFFSFIKVLSFPFGRIERELALIVYSH